MFDASVLLLQVLGVLSCIRLLTNRNVSRFLSVALLFYVVQWYVIPITLITVLAEVTYSYNVERSSYLWYAGLESAALVLVLFIFDRTVHRKAGSVECQAPTMPVFILVTVGVVLSSVTRATGKFVSSYIEINRLVTVGSDALVEIVGPWSVVTGTLVALGYACVMSKWPKSWLRGATTVVASLGVLVSVILDVRAGARHALLLPFLLVAVHMATHRWRRGLIALVLGVSVVLALFVLPSVIVTVERIRLSGD